MREVVHILKVKVDRLGNDIEEKDIELRDILIGILYLLDRALPEEVDFD